MASWNYHWALTCSKSAIIVWRMLFNYSIYLHVLWKLLPNLGKWRQKEASGTVSPKKALRTELYPQTKTKKIWTSLFGKQKGTDWSTFLHTFPSNSTVFVSFFKKNKNCIQREPFHFKYNKPSRNVHQPGSLKLELLLEECLKPFSMSPPESEWICLEINKIISIWHAFKENQCPNQIHHRKNMTTGEKKKN